MERQSHKKRTRKTATATAKGKSTHVLKLRPDRKLKEEREQEKKQNKKIQKYLTHSKRCCTCQRPNGPVRRSGHSSVPNASLSLTLLSSLLASQGGQAGGASN
ncbi:hypothetical protein FRC18_006787 [Serendipita sp. 400]|nr:hypothetical protein FRC18_006787 [Serendipita sp. 400]